MNPLHLLAEHDRELQAPPGVEARLIAKFQERKLQIGRRRKVIWLGIGAIAASIAAAPFFSPLLLTPRGKAPAMPEIRAALPLPPSIEARQLGLAARPKRMSIARKAAPSREVVTEFFPLMNPVPPFERGQILRVDVPASAMQSVGLPVREEHLSDRIQADVLVGEEGMPRAIRFVGFETR